MVSGCPFFTLNSQAQFLEQIFLRTGEPEVGFRTIEFRFLQIKSKDSRQQLNGINLVSFQIQWRYILSLGQFAQYEDIISSNSEVMIAHQSNHIVKVAVVQLGILESIIDK